MKKYFSNTYFKSDEILDEKYYNLRVTLQKSITPANNFNLP